MGVVVDTSIWVDYLRDAPEGAGQILDELLERDEVLAFDPDQVIGAVGCLCVSEPVSSPQPT